MTTAIEKCTPSEFESSAHRWFAVHRIEIESRIKACFCRINDNELEEATAEVLANVYKAIDSAARRGVLGNVTPYHLVVYAVKHFWQGRRMAGYSTTDVMSEATRRRGRVTVMSMSSPIGHNSDEDTPTLAEVLADRGDDADPFEATRRNRDYGDIFDNEGISMKARRTFDMLSADRGLGCGMRIARALGVSSGRVTQLKDELAAALGRHGYGPAAAAL